MESRQRCWRHCFRHRDEGEIVDRRDLGPAERFLVAVEKEVGRKEDGVAVKGPQKRFCQISQEKEGWSNRQEKAGR